MTTLVLTLTIWHFCACGVRETGHHDHPSAGRAAENLRSCVVEWNSSSLTNDPEPGALEALNFNFLSLKLPRNLLDLHGMTVEVALVATFSALLTRSLEDATRRASKAF